MKLQPKDLSKIIPHPMHLLLLIKCVDKLKWIANHAKNKKTIWNSAILALLNEYLTNPFRKLIWWFSTFQACMAGIVFAKFTKPTMRAETILFRSWVTQSNFSICFCKLSFFHVLQVARMHWYVYIHTGRTMFVFVFVKICEFAFVFKFACKCF